MVDFLVFNGTQRIRINNTSSLPYCANFGISQGSHLGPPAVDLKIHSVYLDKCKLIVFSRNYFVFNFAYHFRNHTLTAVYKITDLVVWFNYNMLITL